MQLTESLQTCNLCKNHCTGRVTPKKDLKLYIPILLVFQFDKVGEHDIFNGFYIHFVAEVGNNEQEILLENWKSPPSLAEYTNNKWRSD